jgi:hypothetical protein
MSTMHFSFGTIATGVAWFGVRAERGTTTPPAWTSPEVNARTVVIPGSFPPRSEREVISFGLSRVTWRLWFPDDDAYHTMLAKLGTSDVLTVLDRVQSHRGDVVMISDRRYIKLPDTFLATLNADSPDLSGQIEAVATFERHIDPATGWVVP